MTSFGPMNLLYNLLERMTSHGGVRVLSHFEIFLLYSRGLFIWSHQNCWFRSFLLIWAIFIDFRVHTAKSIDFNHPRPWAPTMCTLKSRFLPWAPPKLLISSRFLLISCKNIDMKSTFLAFYRRPRPWAAEINRFCHVHPEINKNRPNQ